MLWHGKRKFRPWLWVNQSHLILRNKLYLDPYFVNACEIFIIVFFYKSMDFLSFLYLYQCGYEHRCYPQMQPQNDKTMIHTYVNIIFTHQNCCRVSNGRVGLFQCTLLINIPYDVQNSSQCRKYELRWSHACTSLRFLNWRIRR